MKQFLILWVVLQCSACVQLQTVNKNFRIDPSADTGLVVLSADLRHSCFYLRPILEFYNEMHENWIHLDFQKRVRIKTGVDSLGLFHILELPAGRYFFDAMRIDVYEGHIADEGAVVATARNTQPLNYEFNVQPHAITYLGRANISVLGCVNDVHVDIVDRRKEDLRRMAGYLKHYSERDVRFQMIHESNQPHKPVSNGRLAVR